MAEQAVERGDLVDVDGVTPDGSVVAMAGERFGTALGEILRAVETTVGQVEPGYDVVQQIEEVS